MDNNKTDLENIDLKHNPVLIETQKRVRDEVISQLVAKRKEKKMTQNDVSRLTGIQRPNISRLESGNYNPTIDMLVRVADSMGMKVNIIFEDK